MKKRIKAMLHTQAVIFLLIAAYFLAPFEHVAKRGLFPFVAVLAGLFFLLGITLIVMTFRSRIKGKLKTFLLLTGFSSAGFLVSVLLHNLVYALFIVIFGADFWGNGDEPVFFIIALFVCPIGFLVGAIGSIVHVRRKSIKASK